MRVFAFLARSHGLSGLRALLKSYQVIAVATHRFLPRPLCSERPDYAEFAALSAEHGFALHSVDNRREQLLLEQSFPPCDLIVSISWRRLIPKEILEKARIGGVNLHRGYLPDYPGAEPIKQALQAHEKRIAITAHLLEERIDAGEPLCFYRHPVNYRVEESLEQNVERLKEEITPHFGPLLLQSLQIVIQRQRSSR